MSSFMYRVWDILYKKWLEDEPIYINKDGQVCELQATCYGGETWLDEDVIDHRVEVNKFTGLNDINLKMIYEGDIINYHRHVGDYFKSQIVYKTGVVIWEDDKCSFRIKHNGGDTEKLFTSHRIEVVGNIYENPELLSDEN